MSVISPSYSSSDGGTETCGKATKTSRRRKTFSCLSCKRLKIKCDKNKPTCEYCEYRGKKCEYPEEQDLEMVQLKKRNLNSTTSLMNISFEELFLLKVYDQNHVQILGIREGTIRHSIWQSHVPKMVNESAVIRNSIFGLSSLAVMGTCDANRVNDVYITNESPHSVYVTVSQYFQNQVTALNEICSQLNSDQAHLIKWNEKQIGEIVVLNYTFFIFCCLHPHKILPLIYFEDEKGVESPDILGIVRGFSLCMNNMGTEILETKFVHILFFEERLVQLPPYQLNYKPIESLRSYLEIFRDYMPRADVELFDHLVRFMELCIYRCFKFKYFVPLFRWMFAFDERMLKYLRQRHVFALKLMYVYSILSQFSGFNMSLEMNIWVNFVEDYKAIGPSLLDGPHHDLSLMIWWDEYDQRLYNLVKSNFRGLTGMKDFEEVLSLLGMDDKIVSMDMYN